MKHFTLLLSTVFAIALFAFIGCSTNQSPNGPGGSSDTSAANLPNNVYALTSPGTGVGGRTETRYVTVRNELSLGNNSGNISVTGDSLIAEMGTAYIQIYQLDSLDYQKKFGFARAYGSVHFEGSFVPGNGDTTPAMRIVVPGLQSGPAASQSGSNFAIWCSGQASYSPGLGGFQVNGYSSASGGTITYSNASVWQQTLTDGVTGKPYTRWYMDLSFSVLLNGIQNPNVGKGKIAATQNSSSWSIFKQ